MSLVWTTVFYFLCIECALVLPCLITGRRWQGFLFKVMSSRLTGYILKGIPFVATFLGILFTESLWSFYRSRDTAYSGPTNTAMNIPAQHPVGPTPQHGANMRGLQANPAMFYRVQRNMYISGAALYLLLVLKGFAIVIRRSHALEKAMKLRDEEFVARNKVNVSKPEEVPTVQEKINQNKSVSTKAHDILASIRLVNKLTKAPHDSGHEDEVPTRHFSAETKKIK